MAFQAVPDAAEAVITYTQNDSVMKTVLHAFKPGGYNLADLTVLASAVDLAVAASFLPIQTVEVGYNFTTVRGLAFENDQEVVDATSAGLGGVAGPGLPSSVTFSIKKSSGLTGRSARGRLYWIGLLATNLAPNENQLDVAAQVAAVAAVDAMRAAIGATVWTPAIVSRFSGGVPRTTGVTFTWTTTTSVNTNVDSQRRRLL